MFQKRGAALFLALTVAMIAPQGTAYADDDPGTGSDQAVTTAMSDTPAGADVSPLATTVTCGSGGVSDPDTLVSAGATVTNLAGSYYKSTGSSEIYVKVGTTSSGTAYGWTKDTSPAVLEQITTGWWDNSGGAHWCGWGGDQHRTVASLSAAYTSAVRKDQATYIRGHVNPYDWAYGKLLGWQHGSKVAF
ncbi:hypothetical protein GCM10017673_53240 [Streptosporangium violaceochromogenes]|nr:hypothetical protein GCM10017673_53240 [Streptosporangium violaceochromogenes]